MANAIVQAVAHARKEANERIKTLTKDYTEKIDKL